MDSRDDDNFGACMQDAHEPRQGFVAYDPWMGMTKSKEEQTRANCKKIAQLLLDKKSMS